MGVLVPGPASAGPQADCGTDQDATYGAPLALTPGVRCDAKVNDCDDATDYFTFTATGADGVRITFTGSGIVAYYLYGPEGSYGRLWDDTTFVVPSYGEGAVTYSISAYYNHNQRYYPGYYKACGYCDPYYGGCSYYEYIQEYDLRVDVTANTRPYVVASGPLSVIYGEPTEYAVYGLDADENGRRVGAAFAPPTPPTWTDGGFPSTKTFTYAFPDSRVAGFFAEDTVGAVASTFLGVTAREDDCGSGDDVATLARTLPFDCHGTLWEPIADHADAYTFTVPSGTPRLYAGYSPFVSFATGDATVRLVSPTGALAAEGTDTPLFVASPAAGTWTLELLRAAGSGSYDVTVAGVGEPTRPRLGVVVSDAAPHQYDEVAVEVAATHANGERVRYDVDWGDGTTARLPAVGTAAAGAPLVARHVYGVPAPDPRVRVVATDDDGLTDTVTVPMTVGWHYDCGFLKRGYDAPADPDSVLVFRPEPTCLGDLGHTLADGSVDVADVYRFSEHTGIAPSVRLTMAHDPGLDASLYVDWYVFGVGAVRFLGSGDPPTVNIPAAFEGDYFVHLVRDGGKGAYTLTFDEAVPP